MLHLLLLVNNFHSLSKINISYVVQKAGFILPASENQHNNILFGLYSRDELKNFFKKMKITYCTVIRQSSFFFNYNKRANFYFYIEFFLVDF